MAAQSYIDSFRVLQHTWWDTLYALIRFQQKRKRLPKQNESGMDDDDVQAPQKLGQRMINQCRAKHKLTKEQIAALKVFQDGCGSRHQKQSM